MILEPGARVLVAMSGGVDSSVAAALLVEEGYDVVGVTMKTFCYSGTEDHGKTCCGLDGIVDARRVAERLGFPHYVFDVEEQFARDVIDDFVDEYAQGRTPNPCVNCNSNTKFRDLLLRGEQLGCQAIASGHYVRVQHRPEGSRLLRGLDPQKDQSYFLWGLPREILPKLLFPVGNLTKEQVRERARGLVLPTAEKPESQEICFVPSGDYRDLLKRTLRQRHPALEPGRLVLEDGTDMGGHQGYASFTVGQRKGLGGGFPEPMFVLEIRADSREVVIGPRESLYALAVRVGWPHWLLPPPEVGDEVRVQIRYRAPAVRAVVMRREADSIELRLLEPQSAVSPGQSAVLFHGDVVLGGGRITAGLRANEVTAPAAP